MPQVKSTSKIVNVYSCLFRGVLCVGGHLTHANLPDEAKYQRFVSKESRLATLVIEKTHLDTFHGGPNQVMAQIRSTFWIPNNRSAVRQELQQCVKCSRLTAKSTASLMGGLSKERVDVPTRAFENVGLDFAGTFLCKSSSKARTQDKAYNALFVCFASKAVHVECESNMTTLGGKAGIRRFITPNGCPVKYSLTAEPTLLAQPTRFSNCKRLYLKSMTTRCNPKLVLSAFNGTSYPQGLHISEVYGKRR